MPKVMRQTLDEIVLHGKSFVRAMMEARRRGVLVTETMLGDHIARQLGLVLPPQKADAVFKAVLEAYCPYRLSLQDIDLHQIIDAARSFEPVGVMGLQMSPFVTLYFAEDADRHRFTQHLSGLVETEIAPPA